MPVRVRFPSEAHQSLLEEILTWIFCLVSYLSTEVGSKNWGFAPKYTKKYPNGSKFVVFAPAL